MKKYRNNIFFLAVSAIVLLSACKKEETEISYTGGTAPVLSSNVANNDTLVLVPADSANSLFSFSWTNPNYTFTDGLSSQNVNYYVEFDTVGANFAGTDVAQVSVGSSALDTTFTVGELNAILGNDLSLSLGHPYNVEVRVESFLGSNAVPLYSNVFTYNLTPYAPPPKVAPPDTYADNPQGNLFIVGDATAGNWDNPIDKVAPSSQQFTQVSPTEYTITIALIPGGSGYKFIGVNGSWTDQWSVAVNDDPSEVNGGPFVYNGNNVEAPAAAGTYVIDLNFQTGIFTVTPQ